MVRTPLQTLLRSHALPLCMVLHVLWGALNAQAQPFELKINPFQIILPPSIPSPPRINTFNGGVNRPLFQLLDIDGDGNMDLFLLDVDGHLNFYRGIGLESPGNPTSPGYPRFLLESIRYFDINAGSWFRFVDIDKDGDYDLFCNGPQATVKFYRNVGNSRYPSFLWEIEALKDTAGNPILSEAISVPAFADLDGDGDLDFFSGNSAGTIWYYENVGTREEFRFRFVTDKYQGIEIIGLSGKQLPADRVSSFPQTKQALHGAMAITFVDIDGDLDLDLFWGDFFNRSLYFLENRGTRTSPQLVLRDSTYPKPASIETAGFNMPQFIDIDNDGDLDMVVGVLYGTATIDNFLFYRNRRTGLPSETDFRLETSNLLQTLDVGAASSPALVDVDGDGLDDLLIGSEEGKLFWFKRYGALSSLRFEYRTDRFINLPGLLNVSPTGGDIDGDGKPDLIIGDAGGRLRLYRGSNYAQEDTTFPLRTRSLGQNAAPLLVDIERRGLLDLFVGTGGGRILYFRNLGTRQQPNFVQYDGYFPSLDSLDVGDDAKPAAADIDGDGDLDLIIGSRDSSLFCYRNTNGVFSKVPRFFLRRFYAAEIDTLLRTAPLLFDYDQNGVPDLILGNLKGGLYFFHNHRSPTPSAAEGLQAPARFALRQNYPNPFNAQTTIRYSLGTESTVKLAVYDVLGREVAILAAGKQMPGDHAVSFDASALPSGVYFYRLSAEGVLETKKMLFIR
jgi:hypothetical protein